MSVNGNGSDSQLQRIAIAVGTLIVVILTVVIAIFLAFGEGAEEEPPPTEPVVAEASATPTNTLQAAGATDTPLPEEPTETPLPPTATDTPPAPQPDTPTSLPPPPPTETPTPQPVADTPTTPPTEVAVVGTPPRCQAPADWVEYEAVVGDTYNNLAERTGVAVADLLDVNCPETATLRPRETVYLPFIPPTPTATFTPGPTSPPAATPTRTGTPVRPEIDDVAPDRADEGYSEPIIITVLGKNFFTRGSGFRAELRGPQNVPLELREVTLSEISFEAIVPAGLPDGTYDLVVTNPDGKSDIFTRAFIVGPVTPTPETCGINEIDPDEGPNDTEVSIEVRGRCFEEGLRAELVIGDDVIAILRDIDVISEERFTATVPEGLSPATYLLQVINLGSSAPLDRMMSYTVTE